MLKSVLVLCLLTLNGFKFEITDPWVVKIKFSYGEYGGTFVHDHYILTKAIIFLN